MAFKLRPYQAKLKADIYAAINAGNRSVLAVLPTGGGKSVLLSDIIMDYWRGGSTVVLSAHRNTLISQLAMTLAKQGIPHSFVASKKAIKSAAKRQRQKLGKSFYNPSSPVVVSSVQTMVNRNLGTLAETCKLYVTDEAHHNLADNSWGKCAAKFPNAVILGLTATPKRGDRKGLGVDSHGIFETMVIGPSTEELMQQGALCRYRYIRPPTPADFILDDVNVTAGGDFNREKLTEATDRSSVYGDVVQTYLRRCRGMRSIVFAVSVNGAKRVAEDFKAHGIPAEALSAEDDEATRDAAIDRFESGETLVLINVDLFDEGFDVPAVEVLQMARRTESLAKYLQMCGRVLRPDGDKVAIIIDHVNNLESHGLPNRHMEWSLDSDLGKRKSSASPRNIREITCTNEIGPGLLCMNAYDATLLTCPFCGAAPTTTQRKEADTIDTDLIEIGPEEMQELLGTWSDVWSSPEDAALAKGWRPGDRGLPVNGFKKAHRKRLEALTDLNETINAWADMMHSAGITDDVTKHRMFVSQFGTNTAKAMAMGRSDAETLMARIKESLL